MLQFLKSKKVGLNTVLAIRPGDICNVGEDSSVVNEESDDEVA